MNKESAIRFLPLAIDLRGRRCLVVGGGAVGERKALTLLRSGAEVVVVAPGVSEGVAREAEAGRLRWVRGEWDASHLEGVFLVVAATDDGSVNEAVVGAAGEKGILYCDASSMERTQVAFGALLEGEGVKVGVFSDGRDPALSRRTRDRLAKLLRKKE